MNVTGNGSSGDFSPTLPKPGMHQAILTQVIDLGTQKNTYQAKDTFLHKVRLTFEIPGTTYTDPNQQKEIPVRVSREFTATLNPKGNLKPFIVGMLARDLTEAEMETFDLFKLLKKNFNVNITIDKNKDGTKEYANINSATPLMDGQQEKKPVTELIKFDFTDKKTGSYKYGQTMIKEDMLATFNVMPDYLKEKIQKSKEYSEVFVSPAGEHGVVSHEPEEEIF